jgi:hypothetical protein
MIIMDNEPVWSIKHFTVISYDGDELEVSVYNYTGRSEAFVSLCDEKSPWREITGVGVDKNSEAAVMKGLFHLHAQMKKQENS